VKTLSLGYSPCPNDTFIFYALTHGRVATGDLQFHEVLEDVETLNQMARLSKLDVTKASYHAFGHLREQYCLLRSGGALGKGCGPLVVAREDCSMKDLKGKTMAIPGRLTTAALLLQIHTSAEMNTKVMPFHLIIDAVKNGDADAGLIIHESRFTYQKAGLRKIIDLGEWWEEETGMPIPLGGILARRELGVDIIKSIDLFLRRSIEYAFANRKEPVSYIKEHSQELEDGVIEQHINLYVNDYSLDIGDDGVLAVEELFKRAEGKGIIPTSAKPLFVVSG
jgi:1,4-dihydroxy-6-naphthoate synthase